MTKLSGNKFKTTPIRVVIERTNKLDDGLCEVKVCYDNGKRYIELHGNELECSFPLVFYNEKEIEEFCNKLKELLK
jgi:hypothetical protein